MLHWLLQNLISASQHRNLSIYVHFQRAWMEILALLVDNSTNGLVVRVLSCRKGNLLHEWGPSLNTTLCT